MTRGDAALERYYHLGGPGHNPVRGSGFTETFNAAPSQSLPILRLGDAGPELALCRWGLVPSWAKTLPDTRPINARAETVADKPYFRSAFRRRRCLVPAGGYYEWQAGAHGKQPWFIHPAAAELFSFAGIWDRWEHGDTPLDSFAIITTTANPATAAIHQRMPVILDPGQHESWLQEGGTGMLVPYPGELACHPVSTRVNSPRNNAPDLIEPVAMGPVS